MNDRERAEENIKKQLRRLKSQLKKAEQNQDSVPYDKDAARKAVQHFLDSHPDKEKFIKALDKKMKE